ncbi:MAG: stage V sporulation protein S [Actinomycetota bacterium]|nr:stage V sporulation protein S [Actinomycetota bacterium]
MDVLKVSAKSSPNAVAGAIAGILREQGTVCVQIIGAGALNQAIKAAAIARSFVEEDGIDAVCVPSFHDVEIGGENRTAIRLTIEDRARRTVPIEQAVPAEV